MVDFSGFLTYSWFVVLAGLLISVFIFPLVLAFSFLYSFLRRRYVKAPWIMLMAVCTFLGVLLALVLLEVYLGYTLKETFNNLVAS